MHSNLLLAHESNAAAVVDAEIASLIAAAHARELTLIVVTNEVGMGIVPDNVLARAYRDDLGRVNAAWAAAADEAYFVVAGKALRLA